MKNETEPNWRDYPKQQEYWEEFKEYKLSAEAHAKSQTNKDNSSKNLDPHRLGSRGYLKKIAERDR